MNLKNRLLHLAHLSTQDRQTGRTTLVARAAKELDGIVIAHNHDDAKRIERQYGVTARSMDMNLFGFNGPFFIDHHAVERLFVRAAEKIQDLENENGKLKELAYVPKLDPSDANEPELTYKEQTASLMERVYGRNGLNNKIVELEDTIQHLRDQLESKNG